MASNFAAHWLTDFKLLASVAFFVYCTYYIHQKQNEVKNIVIHNFPTQQVTYFMKEEDDINYEDIILFDEFVENDVRK